MLDKRSKSLLGTLILSAVVCVTLVVAPYTLLEPINLPKLCTLAFFAIISLSLIAPAIKSVIISDAKVPLILIALFILQIILVLFLSGANFGGQFYGTYARNTGALAYASLAILLLGSILVSDRDFLKKFVFMTLSVGAILVVYGNMQYFNLDPLPFTTAYTVNAPVGTLGNPDFQSAFMGLIALVSFTVALNSSLKLLIRLGLALMGLASIVVIYETLAKQGYFAFIAGVGVIAVLWLFMTKRKSLGIAVGGIGVIGGGLILLGLINSGPLASYIYKGSLAARGFYWRAALKMLTTHPFFGIGMDGFIDWYRRYRDPHYAAKNFFSYSNAAHNVFLDIGSSGGFPLLVIYCAIIAFVIISIVLFVKRSEGFDIYFAAVVGAWAAYQVQSFISINQLGLAIWGWVLSGLIIGYEINTRVKKIDQAISGSPKSNGKKRKSATQPLAPAKVISLFSAVIIACSVAIPPYYANASYFSAMKSGNVKAIQSAAYLKPIDERRLLYVSTVLRDNKYEAQAIAVVRDAVRNYPDSFDLWMVWATVPSVTAGDLAHAVAQLQRLDPYNPDVACWKCQK